MKKLLALSLVMLFVSISTAAFAAGVYHSGQFTLGTNTPISISTSKDVNIEIQLSAQTGTAPNILVANWVMATYHKAGSRTFGTSNADQKLYFHENTGVSGPAVVDTPSTPPSWTGWAPL